MNSIRAILKDKSLWVAALFILALFVIVPTAIFTSSYALAFVIWAVLVVCLIRNIKGFTCIIFAYSLMLPYGDIKVGTGASTYITYTSVFLCFFIIVFLQRKKIPYKLGNAGKLFFLLLLLSITFALINDSFDEFLQMIYFAVSTVLFFYICFVDRLSLKEFYIILDLIFYCTFFYVIQESVFHDSPYQFIYKTFNLEFQLRAKGLMGHPLLLSSFLSFYHVVLITKGIIFKKWNVLNFILLLPLIVFCASKTVIVLVIISWLIYFLLTKAYKNARTYIVITVFAGILLQVFPLVEGYISAPIERILNSNANQRLGSYPIASQVISNNLLGIGISKDALSNELRSSDYVFNEDYDSSFLIFDNAYLTSFTAYGLFAILFLAFYFNPFIFFIKQDKKLDRGARNSMILLFLIWLLQNFSFDSFFYFPVNTFYFLISSSLIKEVMARKAQAAAIKQASVLPATLLPATT